MHHFRMYMLYRWEFLKKAAFKIGVGAQLKTSGCVKLVSSFANSWIMFLIYLDVNPKSLDVKLKLQTKKNVLLSLMNNDSQFVIHYGTGQTGKYRLNQNRNLGYWYLYFCHVPCPFRRLSIMVFQNPLSFLALNEMFHFIILFKPCYAIPWYKLAM